MSNIYIQEPPTEGKVLLTTSAGEFDIELWSKEAPKAARNFVQLCLEGYYNGTIFHRVVPGFIAQGGDPTGTGEGGESIYGKPFRDEFHSRLRFVRRGLVAMANAGPHDNGSQFFFTLGQTQELQNKHTIFGKLTGNTQYNLSRFEEGEIEENDRPAYPHKIIKTEVLNNPYPDIEPRVKIKNEISKEERKSRKKGTKNFKLLSFGDEAEEEEEEVMALTKSLGTKGTSAHDIARDPTLSADTGSKNQKEDASALDRIKKKLKSSSNVNEAQVIEKIEQEEDSRQNKDSESEAREKLATIKAENKRLMKELVGKDKPEIKVTSPNTKEPVTDVFKEYLEDKAKYEDIRKIQPKKGKAREELTLAALNRFNTKLQGFLDAGSDGEDNHVSDTEDVNSDDWLRMKISFKDESAPVLAKDASTKDATWYDVNDPRNAIAKRRRDDAVKGSTKKRTKT